jgi:hypothetical protein
MGHQAAKGALLAGAFMLAIAASARADQTASGQSTGVLDQMIAAANSTQMVAINHQNADQAFATFNSTVDFISGHAIRSNVASPTPGPNEDPNSKSVLDALSAFGAAKTAADAAVSQTQAVLQQFNTARQNFNRDVRDPLGKDITSLTDVVSANGQYDALKQANQSVWKDVNGQDPTAVQLSPTPTCNASRKPIPDMVTAAKSAVSQAQTAVGNYQTQKNAGSQTATALLGPAQTTLAAALQAVNDMRGAVKDEVDCLSFNRKALEDALASNRSQAQGNLGQTQTATGLLTSPKLDPGSASVQGLANEISDCNWVLLAIINDANYEAGQQSQ